MINTKNNIPSNSQIKAKVQTLFWLMIKKASKSEQFRQKVVIESFLQILVILVDQSNIQKNWNVYAKIKISIQNFQRQIINRQILVINQTKNKQNKCKDSIPKTIIQFFQLHKLPKYKTSSQIQINSSNIIQGTKDSYNKVKAKKSYSFGLQNIICQQTMFSFVLVCFQLLYVTMMGAFYRSASFQSLDTQYVTFGLVTILGFVLMSSTYRKLSLFSLVVLVFISFFTIEVNTLFMTLWSSCFTAFSKQVTITKNLLVNSVYAALGVIITCMDFIGLFEYWQVFTLIAFIMTIGCSLCSAIGIYGLDTYDGGEASSVFLFSGMSSLMIWFMSVRGKISILQHKKSQSYINYTLGFVGVIIAFFSWPILNMGGSFISFINTNLTSSTSLANSAYINTISSLGVSLLVSSFLSSHQVQSQKLKPKTYIECFINSGIIVSAYNDLALHPVVGIVMALVTTLVTILVDKYLVTKTDVRNQSDFKMVLFKFSKILFRIIWSFLAVCIGAIVVKTRDGSSLWLIDSGSHGTKAGLMIVQWLITLVIGLIFGIIAAVSVNVYTNYRISSSNTQKLTKVTDQLFFQQLQSQTFPIYTDIIQPQPDKTFQEDLTRRVLHESLIQHQQVAPNIYQTNKKNSNNFQTNSQSKEVQKETLVIKNDFSKSNLHVDQRAINLSAMKVRTDEEPIAAENANIKRGMDSKREIVKPDYTPVKRLNEDNIRYESQRPNQSMAEKPKQLKTIPSSSRMAQIHIIEQQSFDKKDPIGKENEKDVKKKLTYTQSIIEQEEVKSNMQRVNS